MKLTLNDIADLYCGAGQTLYGGEAVSQLAHALQSAHFAEQAHASPYLITAALLHDIGHILAGQQNDDVDAGIDDRHESVAIAALKPLFGQRVLAPIALHVEAKRYLSAIDPAYHATLSPASQKSLLLQGGVMSKAEVQRFASNHFADDAVFLRRCDDQAKVPDLPTKPLAHYLAIAASVCHSEVVA